MQKVRRGLNIARTRVQTQYSAYMVYCTVLDILNTVLSNSRCRMWPSPNIALRPSSYGGAVAQVCLLEHKTCDILAAER